MHVYLYMDRQNYCNRIQGRKRKRKWNQDVCIEMHVLIHICLYVYIYTYVHRQSYCNKDIKKESVNAGGVKTVTTGGDYIYMYICIYRNLYTYIYIYENYIHIHILYIYM